MDSFLRAPAHADFFPNPQGLSPTARLLASGVGVEGVEAAIASGWLDPAALLETLESGQPALAYWMDHVSGGGHRHAPDEGPWNWPASPGADFSAVVRPASPDRNPGQDTTSRAQWLSAWCVAHAPMGLGSMRWTSDHHAGDPPAQGASVLAVAVNNGWAPLVEQLLARADAPTPDQVQRMRALRPAQPGVGVKREGGRVAVERHATRYLPLLHQAFFHQDLATARVLLAHGVDPNHVDEQGIPAWYCARNVAAMDLAIAHGADPSLAGSYPVSAPSWWAVQEGSVDAASTLVSRYTAWLRSSLTPCQLQGQGLSQVIGSMEAGTLSSMRAQMKALSVPVDVTWTAHGRTWSLASHALAAALTSTCVLAGRQEATHAFALATKSMSSEQPVMPGIPNDLALSWLALNWKHSRVGTHARPGFCPLLEETRQWVAVLLDAVEQLPAWVAPAQSQDARHALLGWAARALGHLPANTPPSQALSLRQDVLAAVARHGDADLRMRMATDSFDRARTALDAGDLPAASNWSRFGLACWAKAPVNGFHAGTNEHAAREFWTQWLGGQPTGNDGRTYPGLRAIYHHACLLRDLAQAAVPPPQGTPDVSLEDFAHWQDHPHMAVLLPCVRSAIMAQDLPVPSPRSSSGPRL